MSAGKSRPLDGSEALALSRARKEYIGYQDALRQVNVRNIEIALVDSVLSGKINISTSLDALSNWTTTNIDLGMLKWVAGEFSENYESITYYSGTGPYVGDYRESDGEWIVPADTETWMLVMQAVNEGADPSTVIAPPTF